MPAINNLEKLQAYQSRLFEQKAFLPFSLFSESEKNQLQCCYDLMLEVVTRKLTNLTEVIDPEIVNPNEQ